MVNVEVEITEDEKLVLTVDLKKVSGYTKQGKKVLIGSSQGNLPISTRDGKLRVEKFNLNVFRPWTPQERARGKIRLQGWDDEN